MSPLTTNSVPSVPHFGVPSLPPIDLTGIEANPKRKKQQPIGFPTMNRAEADKIIKRKVRTTLARGETLNRLLDDHMVAEMVGDFPAIAFYLQKNEETVFSKYAVPIDIESQEELKKLHVKAAWVNEYEYGWGNVQRKTKGKQIIHILCYFGPTTDHHVILHTDCLHFV